MVEQKKKPSVLIAIFTLNERDGWCAPGIVNFVAAMGQYGGALGLNIVAGMKPIDYARNCFAKDFLDSNFDWLLMIDNDMAPPLDLLTMLDRAEDHMRILVPKFYGMKPNSFTLALGWRLLRDEPLIHTAGRSEWRELAFAGTGVMFVHRSVLQKIAQPWFRFSYDSIGMITKPEDASFCLKAREAGFSTWGNVNFEADHFKTVSLSALAKLFERSGARPVSAPLPESFKAGG